VSTFDSSRYNIPTLIEKLRDQRFDGYDPESLAQEVEKFREGNGTAGMGDAVDALKKVAGALSQTDTTLRDQLAALGVVWQSEAAGQAGAVLTEQAGFSSDTNLKVAQAAQLILEQGEAFNRTRNKLPGPDVLRQGEGGFSVGDTLFSLFGFETDHAKNVRASLEAKAQAVDALNAYAHDSGNYLASSEPVAAPESMELISAPGTAVRSLAAAPPPVEPVPDIAPTQAASAKDMLVRSAPLSAAAPPPVREAPTLAFGMPAAAQTGAAGTTGQQATTPSSVTPSSSPVTAPISGLVTGAGSTAQGAQQESVRPAPGMPAANATAPLSGSAVLSGPGGTASPPGGRADAAWGQPGGTGAGGGTTPLTPGGESVPRIPPGGDAVLGKGKLFGAVPGGAAGTTIGPGFSAVRAAGGVGGLAEAAPAIGAAGVGGFVGGERERPDRGSGNRSNDAGKRTRELAIGDLPEEAEAERMSKATPQPPSPERTRAILEPAAPQDGAEDAEHVRRYGIDDRDLFADQRQVAPDLIGDKPLPEHR
jgi:hypothetical protein